MTIAAGPVTEKITLKLFCTCGHSWIINIDGGMSVSLLRKNPCPECGQVPPRAERVR
jgi:hypothetical protein